MYRLFIYIYPPFSLRRQRDIHQAHIKCEICDYTVEQSRLGLLKHHIIRKHKYTVTSTSEPAHEIMVLIALATSEGSGKPAHSRSLAKAFTVRTH